MIFSNPVFTAFMIAAFSAGFGIIAKDDFTGGSINLKPLFVSVGALLFIALAFAHATGYGTPGYGLHASDIGPTFLIALIIVVLGMFVSPVFIIIIFYYITGYLVWNILGRKRIEPASDTVLPPDDDSADASDQASSSTKPIKPSLPKFGKRNDG